jgi:hypothetical protein
MVPRLGIEGILRHGIRWGAQDRDGVHLPSEILGILIIAHSIRMDNFNPGRFL